MLADKANAFAIEAHKGQKYGTHPYVFHLQSVVEIAKKFGLSEKIIAACWLHDVLEDCDILEAELNKQFGNEIAGIVFSVTDEPGDSRKERKLRTYSKIAENESAIQVKLCDRIANLEYSIANGDAKKISMYAKEYKGFKDALFKENMCKETHALWIHLDDTIHLLNKR